MTSESLLLDTHAFFWYAIGNSALPEALRVTIEEAAEVYVSAASVWEIRTKHRLGKMPAANAIAHVLPETIARLSFRTLAVDVFDGDRAGAFVAAHRDPFDRMLAAQALNRGLALVSNDAALDAFGVRRVW